MGILDQLNKTMDSVNTVTNTTNRAVYTAQSAKSAAESVKKGVQAVGSVLEKKCKYCKGPLKTDIEKQKEVCVTCAMARI
jgi:hypothetical protein